MAEDAEEVRLEELPIVINVDSYQAVINPWSEANLSYPITFGGAVIAVLNVSLVWAPTENSASITVYSEWLDATETHVINCDIEPYLSA